MKRGTEPQIGDTVTVTRAASLNAREWAEAGVTLPGYVVVGVLARTDREDVSYFMHDTGRKEVHRYELRPAYMIGATTRRLVSRGTWQAVEVEVIARPDPDA